MKITVKCDDPDAQRIAEKLLNGPEAQRELEAAIKEWSRCYLYDMAVYGCSVTKPVYEPNLKL